MKNCAGEAEGTERRAQTAGHLPAAAALRRAQGIETGRRTHQTEHSKDGEAGAEVRAALLESAWHVGERTQHGLAAVHQKKKNS